MHRKSHIQTRFRRCPSSFRVDRGEVEKYPVAQWSETCFQIHECRVLPAKVEWGGSLSERGSKSNVRDDWDVHKITWLEWLTHLTSLTANAVQNLEQPPIHSVNLEVGSCCFREARIMDTLNIHVVKMVDQIGWLQKNNAQTVWHTGSLMGALWLPMLMCLYFYDSVKGLWNLLSLSGDHGCRFILTCHTTVGQSFSYSYSCIFFCLCVTSTTNAHVSAE